MLTEGDARRVPAAFDACLGLLLVLLMPVLVPLLTCVYFAARSSEQVSKRWAWLFVHQFGMPMFDWLYSPAKRKALRAGCHGRVLDFGCGTLPYAAYYAELKGQITEIVALEPNPECAAGIARAAQRYPELRVSRVQLVSENIPDASFDTVVLGNVLCEVPDCEKAVADVYRILRPGGAVVFVEHLGEPPGTTLRALQDGVQPVWGVVSDGCHCNRDQLAALEIQPWARIESYVYRNLPAVFPHIRTFVIGVALK